MTLINFILTAVWLAWKRVCAGEGLNFTSKVEVLWKNRSATKWDIPLATKSNILLQQKALISIFRSDFILLMIRLKNAQPNDICSVPIPGSLFHSGIWYHGFFTKHRYYFICNFANVWRVLAQMVLLLYMPPTLTECQITTIAVLQRGYVKTQKIVTENSNLHRFKQHRPSSKDTKLLFQVIPAIINQVEIHMDSSSRCDVTVHIFCFLFLEEIFAREKKQKCKILYQAYRSACIYTCVPCTHIRKHIFCRVEIESIWILRALRHQVSRSHPDAWAQMRRGVPHVQCVFVCICTRTPTYTPNPIQK